MHIGIDVGGTNTDAVLVDGRTVRGWAKTPTTRDVGSGIVTVLRRLLKESGVTTRYIKATMIGTTHFTNAVVERRRLLEVAAVRLALPAARCLPPMTDWPGDLADTLGRHTYMAKGGNEFDGRAISELDEAEIRLIGTDIRNKGLKVAAVTAVFSPVTRDMEIHAAEILRSEVPGLQVSLSHEIGRIGLLERENATIVNASLI